MKGKPDVFVYDNRGRTCDRYTVLIGEDAFFMSDNANSPNGVCMYAGEADSLFGDQRPEGTVERVYFGRLPSGVQNAINYIIRESRT